MKSYDCLLNNNIGREDYRGKSTKIVPPNLKGITFHPLEVLAISSKKDVIRGLHYQKEYRQSRMISLISGRLFVVAVNIDVTSDNLGKVYSFILENDNDSVLISPDCAVGTLALTDSRFLCMFGENGFVQGKDAGIIWNDKEIGISWPNANIDYIISEKDKLWPTFSEYKKGGYCE